jgi:ABC-type nitrate/sulfonate/bicarbonate transport system permease component
MSASAPLSDIDADDLEVLEPGPAHSNHLAAVRLVSIVVVLGLWQLGGAYANPLFLPTPFAIAVAAWKLTIDGELATALLSSLSILLGGFVIASVIGIACGLLIGRYKLIEAATDWLINALYATPLVAVIPLVILWFGLGDAAKLFIVIILSVFPVLINTIAGVHNVPRNLVDVGTAFAAREREVFVKIILPSALPYMMTGLRLGIGRAIIGMVVAEFFTAITGLGALISKYGNQYDTAAMFVPILVLMVLGIILTFGVRRLEEWIAPWKRSELE